MLEKNPSQGDKARRAKKTLNDRTLKALKPAEKGEGTYDQMDALIPGFGVRVSEAGRKTFVLAARYPEVNIWFGRSSMQWWAMAPHPAPGWLLTAESPLDLAALLDVYRVTQRPPAPVRRRSRGRHGRPRPVLPGEQPHRGSWLAVA